MRRLLVVLAFFWGFGVQAAEQKKAQDVAFDFDGVQVSQVLRVVFVEVLRTPFVLDPAVLQDQRQVSFRWASQKGEIRPFLRSFLGTLGYALDSRGGVDFVGPVKSIEAKAEDQVFVYRPLYRDGSFLVDLLGPLFKGSFTVRRSVHAPAGASVPPSQAVPAGSAAALVDRASDVLVFHGVEAEIEGLKKVLAQVDVAQGEILVKGVLYEVQTGNRDGSAFKLAASILSGNLSVGLGGGGQVLDNFIRLKVGDVDAVLSALSSDSRFKVVSSPSVRVRSGASARFVVGQDVPVLGALSYPQGAGQAVQSVEYRSSGVIFELQPEVRGQAIDLQINQQLSNFVETETGVNSSPTLIKRELSTSVTAQSGDLIVLGGLTDSKDSEASTGLPFLPALLRSRSGDVSRSEILLVLSVQRI